jgi:hypothetical protein
LGIRGGLILGVTAAEILTSYWSSRYRSSPHPPKIYAFNRRIHHGEIGTILALSSLFLRGATPAASVAAIFTGIGIGLVKDDHADIMEWFKLKKKEMQIDQNHQKGERGGEEEAIREHPNHPVVNTQEEASSGSFYKKHSFYYKTKSNSEKMNLEHLRKQIRNLIDIQSQTVKEIELQIKRSQRYLLD